MRQKALAMVCCVAILWPHHARAVAITDQGDHSSPAKEYFSTNAQKRLIIGVQVWGGVTLTGIHYVPDDTTLVNLVGLAGGPIGSLDRARVVVKTNAGGKSQNIEIQGKDLLADSKYDSMHLHDGDIVYVEVEPERDTLGRNLGIISAVTGIITSVLALYLFTRK